MSKKTKKKKAKLKQDTFSCEDFVNKHLVVTQHAQDKWIERTNIKLGKKRIENYIRACARDDKLHHYWKDFYIADDIVFIARKKLPTENEVNFPRVKIALTDILKKHCFLEKNTVVKERELQRFAEHACRKYHFNFNIGAKRKKRTTEERVRAMLERDNIFHMATLYKRKIVANALKRNNTVKFVKEAPKVESCRLNRGVLAEYHEANKDLGIVIISVFGSFQDYPCLQDIRTVVMEKEKYGRMLHT